MRLRVRSVGVVAAAAALVCGSGPAFAGALVENLDGPRGVAAGPGGRVLWAEGSGVVKVRAKNGSVRTLGSVPEDYIAPALAARGLGTVYALTAGGPPGTGAATLYRYTSGRGFRPVADIAAFQAAHPDAGDINGDPEGSNPFGVAVVPGGALVADAQHNNLLKVSNHGKISIVAWLKPRVVAVPDGLPPTIKDEDGNDVPAPPAGTLIPSEGVATSVTVGADGYYYVGELRGFPATPGTSQIWRIAPGTTNAVCDPEAPDVGPCQRFADGLTSIVDLAPAKDGGIYALELAKASWLQAIDLGIAPPIGGLFKVPAGGGTPTEVDTGAPLILPGGVDVGRHGKVYITSPVFGPGMLSELG